MCLAIEQTSNAIQKYSECVADDSENESFNSAFCDMYNDVLNHTYIAKDCETFCSTKECESISPSNRRDRFYTAGRSSSLSSIAFTTASSDMLSMSEIEDDDLSYITEPEFEHLAKLPNNTDKNIESGGTCGSRQIIQFTDANLGRVRSVFDESRTHGVVRSEKNDLHISDLDVALLSPSAHIALCYE